MAYRESPGFVFCANVSSLEEFAGLIEIIFAQELSQVG